MNTRWLAAALLLFNSCVLSADQIRSPSAMSQSGPLMMRLIASSVTAANRAGKIIRDVMSQGDLGIVEKAKDDLQTEADRSAQRCIVASLSRQFPNITIIGEEGVPSDWLITHGDPEILKKKCPDTLEDITEEDVVVWVDPLDGTSEYTQGFLEHVTVLIGISIREQPIGGVIHQPFWGGSSEDGAGRTIWGLQGFGIEGLPPIPRTKEPIPLIVTTSRSHSNSLAESCLEAMKPEKVLRVGGAGYKVLQLLEGTATAYVFASPGCKKWDTCAPEAILRAAGGSLTDILGRPYNYGSNVSRPNRSGVLAAPTVQMHQALTDLIPEHVKTTLKD
ncbi:3'(2'),5'-bisphosphate nucleotidase 1 isoform X5 [Arctopsyche grandis]|uniref:3'(2'),5'-bisphosphate nucleotidase 1 isoform X5 n=2 Tax=Arctopsyche grandis TaxID=121162 RepID=UPI00406D80BD